MKKSKPERIPSEPKKAEETPRELADEELDGVSGGTAAALDTNGAGTPPDDGVDVVSPRDPASGLPTGKRMHKPYSVTGG
jgi:hypothetical protein